MWVTVKKFRQSCSRECLRAACKLLPVEKCSLWNEPRILLFLLFVFSHVWLFLCSSFIPQLRQESTWYIIVGGKQPHKVMGQSPPSACRAALWGKFQSVCLTPTQRADFWLCGRPTRHCHGLWLHTSTTQIESEILCSFSWSTYSFNFYKLHPCRNEGVWFMSPPPRNKMCHITPHLGADSSLCFLQKEQKHTVASMASYQIIYMAVIAF